MSESARTVWTLQRTVLLRARGVIFSSIADLGGPPTIEEEERQRVEDARVGALVSAAIRRALVAAGAETGELLGVLAVEERERWAIRAPALLAFGARTHDELLRVTSDGRDPRPALAAAVFQLAASLLDWIGDVDGGAADVVRWLPPDAFARAIREPAGARALAARARRDGPPAPGAFVTLIALLADLARQLPGDRARFFARLAAAYDAELASFAPPASGAARLAVADRKSTTPTAVVGELARLAVRDDRERALVDAAVETVAGIFGAIDDLADLSDDLQSGAVNTLVDPPPMAAPCDEHVADAMRAVLATDLVERRAADVADRIHVLARTLDDARIDPASRRAALEWLRTTTWRWIA